MVDQVDLDQTAAAKLAGEDRVVSVDREIGVVDASAARAAMDCCSAIVCGSRKSSRLRRSATTIADRPSGVK